MKIADKVIFKIKYLSKNNFFHIFRAFRVKSRALLSREDGMGIALRGNPAPLNRGEVG